MARQRIEFQKKSADVRVGDAVVPFAYRGDQRGWILPGGVFTTSYLEAEAAARLINERLKVAQ